MASPYTVRVFGDPVLRKVAEEITNIDGKLVQLADEMLETMYAEPGLGLAAPQVGVQRRLFVYDIGDGPKALVNPVIHESAGEWVYEEGCLSVPGLYWDIVRPKEIHISGFDLDGNEVSIEADELLSRLFQHELDHLDGILLLDRLDADTRKQAMKTVRELFIDGDPLAAQAAARAASQERSGDSDRGRDRAGRDRSRPTKSAGGLTLP